MIAETSAVAFRQNLGKLLNIVQYRNDSVLIKEHGKPVAAFIEAHLFERIRRSPRLLPVGCSRWARAGDGG